MVRSACGARAAATAMNCLASLRAIATAGATRLSLLPDIPTIAESGLPDFEAVLHYGLMAPAGTPATVVARLNGELRAAVSDPDVKARILADGEPQLGKDGALDLGQRQLIDGLTRRRKIHGK